ncbi:MAG: NAD(P)H-quinone oxidoreductase [Gemmatimonadota bacterium]|nr:NAD(P)H-quinone oxidoreductase [Gemmatimonadota bacterium]
MKAIRIREPGGPEVLETIELPEPVPRPGEALIRVRAAGVNRADLLQRAGRYPPPPDVPADIPGLEFAGEVVELGPPAGRPGEADARSAVIAGSPVMGIVGGGGYAEYLTAPVEHLMPVPRSLDMMEAGGVPEVFLTAFDALFTRGRLDAGERVLIHSAGGGVGSAALQLARAAGAAGVAGTASAEKLGRLAEIGLSPDLGVDYETEDFAMAVDGWTGGRGVDVILDTIGASYWRANVASLAELGRLVIVGVMGGSTTEVDLRALMTRRATVVGTVLRARSIAEKADVTRDFARRFLECLEAPEPALRPVIDRVLPLEEARMAHELMAANRTFGKLVLKT